MSLSAALLKLKDSVKELVVAVTENGTRHIGLTDKDQTEVVEWVEKAGQSDIANLASVQVCAHTRIRVLWFFVG